MPSKDLNDIDRLDQSLLKRFKDKLLVQESLTRPLVSFQANKARPVYRWYKYKEAFSAALVEYFFQAYGLSEGVLLDPFAGSGTALFAASDLGVDADGIELLPIGQQIISTKQIIEAGLTGEDLNALARWSASPLWERSEAAAPLSELRITKGAYPEPTKAQIEKYITAYQQENQRVQAVLRFALLCVLESVSFTCKDGQYLRWDRRAGRKQGKKIYDKGALPYFNQAIHEKLNQILADLKPIAQTPPPQSAQGKIRLYGGSCLDVLPQLPDSKYHVIITSPPYCNRYDYTRTYALELALLGCDEHALSRLRQEMLSCTVESRAKDLLKMNPAWALALASADAQDLLQAILAYLGQQKRAGVLNNAAIPRMVRGYFYEMACVIAECARVLKPGGRFFVVNDNVRYAGVSISADMILSDIAEKLGFFIEHILVLPAPKGNSSQQMGAHGRSSLRKCVYVWRKL